MKIYKYTDDMKKQIFQKRGDITDISKKLGITTQAVAMRNKRGSISEKNVLKLDKLGIKLEKLELISFVGIQKKC